MAWLTSSQKDYVIFHLKQGINFPPELLSKFNFLKKEQPVSDLVGSVIFYCSETPIDIGSIIRVDSIPVIFPVLNEKSIFHFDESNNLIFHHDLFRSIFYLLSGYQEFENTESKDNLGRFNFEDSIQSKLGIAQVPVVNYYFQWLSEALVEFGKRNGMDVQTKKLFSNFGFLLSHDIDSVDLYTYEFVVYKIKELLGGVPSARPFSTNAKLFFQGLVQWLGVTRKDNPHWNFEYMRRLERSFNFRSTFYFLDKGLKHQDAYYDFEEKRLVDLYRFLKAEDCEIGTHGTVRSGRDKQIMLEGLRKLEKASDSTIVGIRQHRLLWIHPMTATIQSDLGLKYDTTLGFAANEGFRNSYCLPFKLYDFENDKMLDIWEFPLVVMDVTLFAYQKYSMVVATEKCEQLLGEVIKFNGLFTLLWHNSFFEEETYPGVTKFYETLLQRIANLKPENLLGSELVDKLNRYS